MQKCRSAIGISVLLAGALLLMALGIVFMFVPLAACPNCGGRGTVGVILTLGGKEPDCGFCAGKGKVAVRSRWQVRHLVPLWPLW